MEVKHLCIARVWSTDKQRKAGKPLWTICSRPAKGITYMEGTAYTGFQGNRGAPACGIHLHTKFPPEWTGSITAAYGLP